MAGTYLQIRVEDMDRLHAQLPELTFSVSGPDLETITQFFLIKSVTGTLKAEDKEETAALEDRLVSIFVLRRLHFCLSLEGSVFFACFVPAFNIAWLWSCNVETSLTL
jgi:hypothetical protein